MKKICSSLTIFCFIFVFVLGNSFAQQAVSEIEAEMFNQTIITEFATKAIEVKNYTTAEAECHIEKVFQETAELASEGKISQEEVNSVRTYYELVKNMDGKTLSEYYLKTANNMQTLNFIDVVNVIKNTFIFVGMVGLFIGLGSNVAKKNLILGGAVLLISGIIIQAALK